MMHNGGTALTAYTAHLAGRGLRPATITAYVGWVRRLSTACGDPATLTTADLELWIAGHTWKPWTHQKAVASIRYYYGWLLATGRIDHDPSAPLIPARSPRPVPNPAPEDVYRSALERASGQDYWRLRLAGDTGLRRAELAAVHSDDVRDLVTGPTLRVEGKGGVTRWVPLPDDLAAWIRMQRGHVWPDRSGLTHITPHGCGDWYKRRLGLHVHMLRHRFATRAYASGHDIEAVRELLGHASTTTTQTYVKVASDDLLRAAKGAWLAA